MKRKIIFLLFFLISTNSFGSIGINSSYWLISQADYDSRISNRKDVVLRRYLIVPAMDKNYKDILETRDEQALLAKFSYILKKNKFSRIEEYIENCDPSLDINNLIMALYFFSNTQYDMALTYLEKLKNEDYRFLKLMMIADCKYEMLPEKKNYKAIIGDYQLASDSTDDEQNKAMINNRIKFIKYQY